MIFIYSFVLIVALVVCVIVIFFYIAEILAAFTTDAPFVPVPKEIDEKIIETLELKEDSVLFDLGCGDGRILIKATQKYPSIKAVGVEKAFNPYLLARFRARKYKNIVIKREDIFKTDFSQATHIFLYLYPEVMEKLLPIIQKKCKPGTRIVSCDFKDKNIKEDDLVVLKDIGQKRGKNLFVYTVH